MGSEGLSAADVVNQTPEADLADLIYTYGEETPLPPGGPRHRGRPRRGTAHPHPRACRSGPQRLSRQKRVTPERATPEPANRALTRRHEPFRRFASSSTTNWPNLTAGLPRRSDCYPLAAGWPSSASTRWKTGASRRSCARAPARPPGNPATCPRRALRNRKTGPAFASSPAVP